MEFKPRTQDEWTQIHVRVLEKYYLKHTEKAIGFNLWDKKKVWFPIKLVRDYKVVEGEVTFTIAKWYITEHNLKSIVEDFDKEHFPTKKQLAERLQQGLEFSAPVPVGRVQPPAPVSEEKTANVKLDDDYGAVEW